MVGQGRDVMGSEDFGHGIDILSTGVKLTPGHLDLGFLFVCLAPFFWGGGKSKIEVVFCHRLGEPKVHTVEARLECGNDTAHLGWGV